MREREKHRTRYIITKIFYSRKCLRKITIQLLLKLEGGYFFSRTIRRLFVDFHGIYIGYGSYGGCFSTDTIPRNVTFGNYCSIAPNVRIFRANHPIESFTTHPILYNPACGYVSRDMLERKSLVVGHDVWIGESVIILPSVFHIGNGAVIGAGSVVTKDVEAYTIVAGNPAKKIRDRFNRSQVAYLEEIKWWELDKDQLVDVISELEANLQSHRETTRT